MQFKSNGGIYNQKGFMELSPKQQAVNEIKNAKRILVLGHKMPDGDQMGSLLALKYALEKLEKSVDIIISDKIDDKYKFLPGVAAVKSDYRHTDGKILKIDTKRIPIDGMKWQKEDDFLNIYLDTDKNLKFEFIEIINGMPKPDLIVVVDTPDIKKIDRVYDSNASIFFESPILNIDHHPGNEYFGTINLVDLTATSTAEILVSLFEALGIKIDTPDIATCLLAGILFDTQSFRGQNTTPKSLTVAAQLLAAGGRQQEIIKSYYGSNPDDLLKTWEQMLQNLNTDLNRKIMWTKISKTNNQHLDEDEILEAAEDLLKNNTDYEIAMILCSDKNAGSTEGFVLGSNAGEALKLSRLFGGEGNDRTAKFVITEPNLDDAEKIVLKKIAERWAMPDNKDKKELWDVIEDAPEVAETTDVAENKEALNSAPETLSDKTNSAKEKEDAIEEALKSISQAERDENRKEFESVRDVIDRKKVGGMKVIGENESDIFEDE
jgi:phosphoesterase RecJ-like protein